MFLESEVKDVRCPSKNATSIDICIAGVGIMRRLDNGFIPSYSRRAGGQCQHFKFIVLCRGIFIY